MSMPFSAGIVRWIFPISCNGTYVTNKLKINVDITDLMLFLQWVYCSAAEYIHVCVV